MFQPCVLLSDLPGSYSTRFGRIR